MIIRNMAEINEELAASLLFGHKRGSFTGAYEDRRVPGGRWRDIGA